MKSPLKGRLASLLLQTSSDRQPHCLCSTLSCDPVLSVFIRVQLQLCSVILIPTCAIRKTLELGALNLKNTRLSQSQCWYAEKLLLGPGHRQHPLAHPSRILREVYQQQIPEISEPWLLRGNQSAGGTVPA